MRVEKPFPFPPFEWDSGESPAIDGLGLIRPRPDDGIFAGPSILN
jgi:hypothetical protein